MLKSLPSHLGCCVVACRGSCAPPVTVFDGAPDTLCSPARGHQRKGEEGREEIVV